MFYCNAQSMLFPPSVGNSFTSKNLSVKILGVKIYAANARHGFNKKLHNIYQALQAIAAPINKQSAHVINSTFSSHTCTHTHTHTGCIQLLGHTATFIHSDKNSGNIDYLTLNLEFLHVKLSVYKQLLYLANSWYAKW